MEHKERNNGIRLKMLAEIADIDTFTQGRLADELIMESEADILAAFS